MYKGGGNAGKWNDNPCDYGAAPGVLLSRNLFEVASPFFIMTKT